MFCRIVAHTAPATIRYEDADIVAFGLADTELAGRLVLVASRIAAEARAKSFRLATNSGAPLQMFSTSTGTSWPTAPWGIRRG